MPRYYLSIGGRVFWTGFDWTDILLNAKAYDEGQLALEDARALQRQVGRYVTVDVDFGRNCNSSKCSSL